MAFERYRCLVCGEQSFIFPHQTLTCQNKRCQSPRVQHERREDKKNREEFMKPWAVVYYLRLGNRVKIGTSTDLPGRMLVVPHEELLAFEFGSYKEERARHLQFAHARVVGEWFDMQDAELTSWIDSLRAGIEDLTDVPRAASRAVKRRILGLDAA